MYSNNNDISKIDEEEEIFLRELLKEFYHQLITINNYSNYENILKDWMKEFFDNQENKDPEIVLKLMENHKENKNWFSSLIGFFYEYYINDSNIYINKNKSLELYMISINNNKNNNNKDNNNDEEEEEDENKTSMYQLINIIIGKYLLSLYYYKDIILNKRKLISKEFNNLENVQVMSHNQYENFNGLKISICNDEINTIEKYFESFDKSSNNNQIDLTKEKEKLVELNNLGFCYQYGMGKVKDDFKAFEFYLQSAEGGNLGAQNNLGYCYQNGIGIIKDEKKAIEWYLKAANGGNLEAQFNLGICYQYGIGVDEDSKKAFIWYYKSAKEEYSPAQNMLGNCYEDEIGTENDLEKAVYWYKKAAENGNKFAQYNLGNCYDDGEGVEKDEIKAFKYYKKSAYQGYLNAQFLLGLCYHKGIGTEINKTRAIKLYKMAAKRGHQIAKLTLEYFKYLDKDL
ncbi:HCP-like protein [Rhizophagus irregularis]|uniref:HCP-like protein n=1 Tax=Rhizophagus irregularis TaxID=588596 RepID=A0A2N0RBX7_9GLOM|nr:HCP-like protein [Rhizophagus irregularis]